jgi:predicted pyridoxine 5'-phosphate oxidase superfamily flavin-nucleotide-binding protein
MTAAEAPFHAGERHMHAQVGVSEMALARGRAMIRDHMPEQHRAFFAQLPWAVVGGLDAQGQPWATVWTGDSQDGGGFMQSPHPQALVIQPTELPGDPLSGHWPVGSPLGLLGIQPHTKRRNRMNGVIAARADGRLAVAVQQSFGNCPKYIVPRHWAPAPPREPAPDGAPAWQPLGPLLPLPVHDWLAHTDTAFIASASADAARAALTGTGPGAGVDVSHRGGEPGFLRVTREAGRTHITLPDYAGNLMFNTLGNVLSNARVGLLLVSPDTGDVLWLACSAHLHDDPTEMATHPGAQRLLAMTVLEGRWARGVWPWRAAD